MFRASLGVRARILAIALVPSLVLLIIGVGGAGYVVAQGRHARNWAAELQAATPVTREFVSAAQVERQLTLEQLAGAGPNQKDLLQARLRLDAVVRDLGSTSKTMESAGHKEITGNVPGFQMLTGQLASVRTQVDAGTLSVPDAYTFYAHLLDAISVGTHIVEADAPTPEVATELAKTVQIISASEMVSRSVALATVLANDAVLPPELAIEYSRLVGGYRTGIETLAAEAGNPRATAARVVTTNPAWQRLAVMENTFLTRALDPLTAVASKPGTTPPQGPLPFTVAEWQDVSAQVNSALLDLWDGQAVHAHSLAAQAADRSARDAAAVGGVLLVAAIAAFMVSLLLANRIIGRLRRLRDGTLALADERLPEIMRQLRDRQQVDVDAESAALDFGTDEIGQVAEAFNHAHTAAVAAAVTEARTREGVRAVFLNIAHRSQVVVRQQLEILDEAESRQEDPDLLDVFFRLDHLATRERRNAENLIILAGGEPGRHWRKPVQLIDVIRSSVSEAVEFSRVKIARQPDMAVTGDTVADLVHLLAELIDNAATFSPPQSQVEVRGSIVGKGLAVEIIDQGTGMPAAESARINETFCNPPDFGVLTLSEDSRLGVFVVAQLAGRHDISVRLAESDYGGVRAIVLVPSKLLVDNASDDVPVVPPQSEPEPAPEPAIVRSAPEPQGSPISFEPSGSDHSGGSSIRPPLPRRRRQASLAPELAKHREAPPAPSVATRTAEQARAVLSAIANGTRQGRQARPDSPDTLLQ
jgi:signal transduction histidine kinase